MGRMASWKDGAAYAPTERPDGFATPRAEPLTSGDPWASSTPGPMAPPATFEAIPQPPLSEVAAGQAPTRDPRDAFAVSSAAIAPGPKPGVARDPREPIVTSAPQPVGPEWASAAGGQLPAPTGPPLPPPGELLPPPSAPPGPRAQPQQRQLAFIASGLCLLGFILPALSPFVLTAAGALGTRIQPLTGRAGASALSIGLATLGWQLLTDTLGRTSTVGMLVSLAFTVVFAVGALRNR